MTVLKSPFLRGIKVVELAGLAPVPFCGLLLADFGADVTVVINKSSKIASFEQRLSRGKKNMWLDFYCPEDLGKLRKLCQNADILLDPYRPGTLEHFGIEPAQLIMENPGLIIARITGYGQTGPMAAKAGHDINYVALSGFLPTISGSRPGPPWPPANLLADFAAGGLLAAFGILAALHRRSKNGGRGCVLDCSMCEGVAYLGTFVSLYGNQQWMWDGEQFGAFTGKCPVYRTYQTSDGKWMAIGALEPKFQAELFKALNLLDVPVDAAELAEKLEQIFLTKSQAEWTQLFRDKDACVTPVLELDKKLGQFEQHKARGTFQQQKMESGHLCWVPRAMPIEIVDVNVKSKSKL